MGGIAGSALAAAVSNAGALGIFAAHGTNPDGVRELLAQMRVATDRPFGANLLLAHDLVRPADSVLDQTSDLVNEALNPLRREVGLEPAHGAPASPARDVEEKLELLLEARIPILSIGLGNPGHELVERCRRQGTRVIAMVTTVEDAKAVESAGVDAIVAQGAEAGGHRSHFAKPAQSGAGLVGTIALVPEIVDSVRVPVIAAGGIVDGRGLVAALALGAQAVMLGTRFVATTESLGVQAYKQALVEGASHETVVTDAASGRYARVLRNRFTDHYAATGAPTLPFGWQGSAVAPLFDQARALEDPDHMALWAGQSTGAIHDIPSVAEVVRRIMEEAERVVGSLVSRPASG
ncbi:2-nitropropane dioxygenase NPD [Fimbriimonas ginsengisoli Gsoil 348]|uniref:Propionate 3-nitronate monooxygenase n=2 Tax=Fimbriimonas ginsengisoli TaxID=1005039 RepID=A0A068NUH1_FIMGI|nr:2-nitropropane dioxygenase NPD [Fimbriimonas ginsengisoli Gsoil 348]